MPLQTMGSPTPLKDRLRNALTSHAGPLAHPADTPISLTMGFDFLSDLTEETTWDRAIERVAQTPSPQPQVPDSLPSGLIQRIVQQTVAAQWAQPAVPDIVTPPSMSANPKRAEDLTSAELLRWRPEDTTSQPIQPLSASSHVTKEPRPLSPTVQQTGLQKPFQFSPFSFQDAPDRLQSVTPRVSVSKPQVAANRPAPAQSPSMVTAADPLSYNANHHTHLIRKGEHMVDLSGYKDLTKPPVITGNGQGTAALTAEESSITETEYAPMTSTTTSYTTPNVTPHPEMNEEDIDVYGEYSGNVKTLVKLVNELPEGVTKQTGAQIIRLTMEAMGISMETVLSDAQAVQSQLLDVVRSNIKKIEEYKTVIRKLESEIRFHQGKANELSEIIDLFILSNATPNMPHLERHESDNY